MNIHLIISKFACGPSACLVSSGVIPFYSLVTFLPNNINAVQKLKCPIRLQQIPIFFTYYQLFFSINICN
jgi:hypothetical protein